MTRASPAWALSIASAMFVLLAAATLSARGVVLEGYVHDIYVAIDTGWRTYARQVPHVDYHSPVGPAYTWPWLVLRLVEPFSLRTILHAGLIVSGALTLLASVVLPRRLAPPLLAIALAGIMTVALTPRQFGQGVAMFTHLAPYNRWCQAAVMLLIPLVLLRPVLHDGHTPRSRLDVSGGLVLGLLLGFMLFVKVTYFLACCGLVGVGLVLGRIGWRTALLALLPVAIMALLIQLTQGNVAAYLADLATAGRAALEVYGAPRPLNGKAGIVMGGLAAAAVLAVAVAAEPWPGVRALVAAWWRALAAALLAIAAVAVMNTQNHTQLELPPLAAALVVMVEEARRRTGRLLPPGGRGAAVAGLLAVGTLLQPLVDAAAILLHARRSMDGTRCIVPAWRGTAAAELLLPVRAFTGDRREARRSCAVVAKLPTDAVPRDGSVSREAARLGEAGALLRPRLGSGERVLALDFGNPYPAFTGTAPPRAALTWWDAGRSFGPISHPPVAEMLRDPAWLLVSTSDIGQYNAWPLYAAAIRRDFRLVDRRSSWTLWRRRQDPRGPGRPEPHIALTSDAPLSQSR